VSASLRHTGPDRFTGALRRAPPWLLTAALGVLYVVLAPSSADLAAASYRSYLFAHAGFTLWDNNWYAGHHLPAYSVLAPALGAALGTRLLAALAATAAAALFGKLLEPHFAPRAVRVGASWFALGIGVELLSGRVPYDLGFALGLAALLTAVRGHRRWACGLAALCALASPVAGAFLALAALAWGLSARSPAAGELAAGELAARSSAARGLTARSPAGARVRGLPAVALAGSALGPILVLAVVFPEGGSEPFAASSFWPALAATVLLGAALPREQRTLRWGALLYAVALVGAYVLSTPVGGNAVRLGALTAGPLAAAVLLSRASVNSALLGSRQALRWRALPITAAAALLLYWQLVAPIRDYRSATGDPAVNASYYTPLIAELNQLARTTAPKPDGTPGPPPPTRIEVVPSRDHWEARWVAPHFALARGWERQLDRSDDAVFYSARTLAPARYRAWLLAQSVSYVALPAAPLDSSGRAEAGLLEHAASAAGLREVWSSPHWRLFVVLGARVLVNAPATLTSLDSDSFALAVPHGGEYTVRVRFTPYWALAEGRGCVSHAPGGWTRIDARAAGQIRVGIDFALTRIFNRGARCR
jgi:hypothetical protein